MSWAEFTKHRPVCTTESSGAIESHHLLHAVPREDSDRRSTNIIALSGSRARGEHRSHAPRAAKYSPMGKLRMKQLDIFVDNVEAAFYILFISQ
ncbi:hypothetical protein ACFSWD_07770 [Paenibacillus xanthanilyticus]